MKKTLLPVILLAGTCAFAAKQPVTVKVDKVERVPTAYVGATNITVDTEIDGHNVALSCLTNPIRGRWFCTAPEQGTYQGERDGKKVKLHIPDENGKFHDVPYKDVGGW